MTRTQALLVVLMCVLLAAWLAHDRRPAGLGAGVAGIAGAPAAADRLGPQAVASARLRERLTAPPAFLPPHRNLFQFRETPPPASASRRPPVLSTALLQRPVRPEMQLVGVADDGRDGVPARTAIVAAAGQLFFVKEGERLLGRYQMVRISPDAAQLKDPDGSLFTLALK